MIGRSNTDNQCEKHKSSETDARNDERTQF